MALLLFVQILLFQIALHCGLAAVIVARAKSTKVVSYLTYFTPDFAGHYLQLGSLCLKLVGAVASNQAVERKGGVLDL